MSTDLIEIEPRQSSNYTAAEIKEGLTVVALCSGNVRRAERELTARGKRIPYTTLKDWKLRYHAQDYERIVEAELPKIYGEIATRCEDLALAQADVEESLLNRLVAVAPTMDARDLSSALRNVGVAKAVNIDKASLVRGRPTEIREDRSIGDLTRALHRFRGVVRVQPGEEPVDAEVVESGD